MRQFITQKPTLWTIGGAFLYCFCFPRWNLFFLAPAAFFCFFHALPLLRSVRHAIQLALIASFIIGIGGFHWIIYVTNNFGQMPYPAAVLMLFLFCIVAAPQLVAFYSLAAWLEKRKLFPVSLLPLFYTCAYVSFEYLFRYLKIFPEHIGNTQVHWLSLAQSASIGGVSLLSFYVVYLGFSAAFLFRSKTRIGSIHLAASITILLLAHFWGAKEIQRLDEMPKSALHFSIAQANIGDLEKIISEAGNNNAIATVVNRYLELTRAANSDLVIWPETAYPLNYPTFPHVQSKNMSRAFANIMEDTIKKVRIPLLFGGYEQIGKNSFNSAILTDKNGIVQSTYRKKNLLLFGEYMPLAGVFPALKQLNPQMGDFSEGPGAVPLLWQKTKDHTIALAVNICYEAIMPEYMRSFARNGAQIYINITNDSWFGPGFEPYQHLQLAQLRTIENRIPMIRATNTGISVAIDTAGRMQKQSPLFESILLEDSVAYFASPKPTFYTKYGDVFSWLCIVIVLTGLAYKSVLSPKRT